MAPMTEKQEQILISTVESLTEIAKTARIFRLAYLYNQAEPEDRQSIAKAIESEADQDNLIS